ncbi:hypothetical protein MLD38_002747 [Melastoma candidum]|uniref:Uncharacterized protein n=1 Tax=Melastoma candidum TaxID=119954 RepID=A0ACB9S0L2_9MYRT|nr:hypothetical protein MLD38_002747 [Melastoma candidum]
MDTEHGHSTGRRSQASAVEATMARRRGNGIFCSASVAHVDDNEDDVFGGINVVSAQVCLGEKLLLNGDYYAGDWLGRLPHGQGKYLWSDGCMYDGEWYKGRTMGKGRFCWPSGATYEGQFNDGFMDGVGIYTAPSGDTYKGSWSRNMKHGHGTKTFVKGDVYEGEWKQGSWHGHGRYRWKNGNCYIGQWKNGVINGKGAMIWSNGNRYEGFWEAGLPKGMGTFRLADGSCYDRWNEDTREQRWAYRASVSQNGNSVSEDARETLKGNDDFVRPRKTSMDCHSHIGMPGVCRLLRIGRVSRQGEMISKGHKNYELMLNLQLGIRHSVSRPTPVNSLDLTPSAFDPKEKMRTRFPPEGSKNTPPHQSCEFRWKDYCPVVFRALRKLFEIDAANYMISLCGDDALREISSPGKSGSFFYLTSDDRYMIKTIKKAEVKALLRMLPAYYKHVQKYQNTLLTKFFGLHCVKLTGATQKKVKADVFRQRASVAANFNLVMSLQVRFVVMGNLFCSQNTIHQCFDLKGSSQGRVTEKPEKDIHTTAPLKDLDLNFVFRLQKPTFQEFRR